MKTAALLLLPVFLWASDCPEYRGFWILDLDTAVQQDGNGNPKGRIRTGNRFEMPAIMLNGKGETVMREIVQDQGVPDTIEYKFASDAPAFKNGPILTTSRNACFPGRIKGGTAIEPGRDFRADGRRVRGKAHAWRGKHPK